MRTRDWLLHQGCRAERVRAVSNSTSKKARAVNAVCAWCVQVGMSGRAGGRREQNESLTLAGIWPEIERGLQQVFFAKTTMSRKEYMELYTYPLSLHPFPIGLHTFPLLLTHPSVHVECP